MLVEPGATAKAAAPARLERQAAAAAVGRFSAEQPAWADLQDLRRGRQPPEPWLQALERATLPPDPRLLAALWGRLDAVGVRRLLAAPVLADPAALLSAGRGELPQLAADPAVQEAWLEPLLERCDGCAAAQAPIWLELLGAFRHSAVAPRLRAAVEVVAAMEPPSARLALAPLLPLLGRQRMPADGALLQRLALRPGPAPWRRAALEGLALGLSAWPVAPLAAALAALARDLDPTLAATALDLLARLPQPEAQARLRGLLAVPLDPAVQARLRRRLRLSPLVLVVHGRQGGQIPVELRALAAELEQRRGSPVVLQALTAEPPQADQRFWAAARRAGALTLVPLLLLPGGHVRSDLPSIAARWQRRAAAADAPRLRRRPFLGAWPAWQHTLAGVLAEALTAAAAAAPEPAPPPLARWLHHPLQGSLAARYVAHLEAVLCQSALATPYSAGAADLLLPPGAPALLLPLTLAANRLSESLHSSLAAGRSPSDPPLTLLPPLLEIPPLRQFLLSALEVLP